MNKIIENKKKREKKLGAYGDPKVGCFFALHRSELIVPTHLVLVSLLRSVICIHITCAPAEAILSLSFNQLCLVYSNFSRIMERRVSAEGVKCLMVTL